MRGAVMHVATAILNRDPAGPTRAAGSAREPSAISTARLSLLPALHLRPITS